MKLLFVNCCISDSHCSRTKQLCQSYIQRFSSAHKEAILEEIVLDGGVLPLTTKTLALRNQLVAQKQFHHQMFAMARQLADADFVLIGAPYWDLSFPTALKAYVENIMVSGITFRYGEGGIAGLCKGKMLTYITTAGGFMGENNFGYDYIAKIAEMIGINASQFACAEMLDVVGNDTEKIMAEAEEQISRLKY